MKKALLGIGVYLSIGVAFWFYLKLSGSILGDLTSRESITTFIGTVGLWPLLLLNGIAKSLI